MSAKQCACGATFRTTMPNAVECPRCRAIARTERTCVGCGDAHLRRFSKFCWPCTGANFIFSNWANGRLIAARAVAQARAAGELLPASAFKCVDCGRSANCYDHRDYNRPLIVDPVCKGCNIKRGPAVPREWSFDDFMQWVGGRDVGVGWANMSSPPALKKLAIRHFGLLDLKEPA